MNEETLNKLIEALHDVALIKGENEALKNENKYLRELMSNQLINNKRR